MVAPWKRNAGRSPRPVLRWPSSSIAARLKGASSASTAAGVGLEVFPAEEAVRDRETDRADLWLHLGDVLAARLFVRALLETPFDVALRPSGARLAEHVESDDVPLVDRGLRDRPVLGRCLRELFELLLAVRDVALLLAQDHRERVVHRHVGRADHLVELVLAHLVDEEAERREVGPGGHVLLEG